MSFMSDYLFTILIATVSVLLYVFIKKRLEFFSKRGLPYIKPTAIDIIKSFGLSSFIDQPNKIYEKVKDDGNPIVGFFIALGPVVLVVEPELAEKILIKEFSHFHDHGIDVNTDNDPLAGHLFNMKGNKWRALRNKLLPTFTSGKLKGMVPAMDKCAMTLINEMKQDKSLRTDVNLKEHFKSYTISVIACCVFALDPESIKNPDCDFRKLLGKFLKPSFTQLIKTSIIFSLPKLANLLKLKFIDKEIDDFFINLTKDALEARKSSGMKRNDFVQLLLELKEKGSVQVDVRDLEEDEKKRILQATHSDNNNVELEITDKLLAAQAFVFIVGGFENTSYLAAITMYSLAKHKDVQAKVREEVKEAIRKHGGLNYMALKDMELLDASINEALRLYSPSSILFRECSKDFTLDNGMTIEKGMKVLIPTNGYQMDTKYWSNPNEFDPERFINPNITPGTYLPFGDGPRICIAQRLALLIAKVIMADTIANFEIQPSSKTQEPLKIVLTVSADAKGGIWGSFDPL